MRCVGIRGRGEVKEILGGGMKRKKDAYKVMCWNNTEENKRRYEIIKNKVEKAVSKALREKAEEAITELQNYPNGMFRLVMGLMTDS